MSIMLKVSHAQKEYGKDKIGQIFSDETQYFKSIKEAKKYMKENYGLGKHKSQALYHDTKSGKPSKSGWFVSFRDKEYDRDTGKYFKFIHEVWASPYKISKMKVR